MKNLKNPSALTLPIGQSRPTGSPLCFAEGVFMEQINPKYHYRIIHDWLNKHYGKAERCQNPECTGDGKRFEYALKKGFEHGRDIERYMQLCSKCHRIYDMTPEKAFNSTRHLAGKYNDNLKLGPASLIGTHQPESTKEKIRKSKIGKRFDPITRKYYAIN